MMNIKLAIYRFVRRITHRHTWKCTDERVNDSLPSSERPYWHIDQCYCGARRDVMSTNYLVGAYHDNRF